MFPFGHRSTGQEPSPKASLLVQGRGAFLGIPKLFRLFRIATNVSDKVNVRKTWGMDIFVNNTRIPWGIIFPLYTKWWLKINDTTWYHMIPLPLPGLALFLFSQNLDDENGHQTLLCCRNQVLFRHVSLYSSMYAPMFFIFFHDVPYWCSCSFPNLFWYALHLSCFVLVSTMIVPPRFGVSPLLDVEVVREEATQGRSGGGTCEPRLLVNPLYKGALKPHVRNLGEFIIFKICPWKTLIQELGA